MSDPAGSEWLSRVPSPALVLGGIATVQVGSALATKLFAAVGPGGVVLLRLLVASIVLLAVWRPDPRGLDRRRLALTVLFGLDLAGMNFSFYEALHRIPLGIAVTIEFVGPLTVAIASSRRALDLVWAALAAAGIVALTHGGGHGLDALGVVFALIAAACWGLYILAQARVGRSFSGGAGLAMAMAVAAVAMLPVGLIQGGGRLLAPRSLGLGAAVGLLSSAIPYSLELEALRRIAVGVFGVLMSLEPAVAALAGFAILGQGLSARAVAGIGAVVIASIGASQRARATQTAL